MTTVKLCPGVIALLLADAMEHGYPGSPRGSSIARILDMVFCPQPRAICPQSRATPATVARGAVMLPGARRMGGLSMTQISAAHDRLQRAGDLAAVLDAAYAAFEGMVAVLHALQDSGSGLFAAAVMTAGGRRAAVCPVAARAPASGSRSSGAT